jgi:type III secretory pathway component EscR
MELAMTVHRSLVSLLAFLLVLVFAAPSFAAERNYWRHSKGHFENTKENKWEEKSASGTQHFVEKDRTEKYVELFDKSRDCTVRLFDDHCTVRFKDGEFTKLYEGKWGGK